MEVRHRVEKLDLFAEGLGLQEGLLDGLMATVVHRLPRFGRYPQQFRQALEQASGGDMRWVAGVGILSCHVVWAELHQDFLSSLGRERTPGAASGNA